MYNPVGLTVLHDLRVAARNNHSGAVRGIRHGTHLGFQNIRGQSGFQNVADHQSGSARA